MFLPPLFHASSRVDGRLIRKAPNLKDLQFIGARGPPKTPDWHKDELIDGLKDGGWGKFIPLFQPGGLGGGTNGGGNPRGDGRGAPGQSGDSSQVNNSGNDGKNSNENNGNVQQGVSNTSTSTSPSTESETNSSNISPPTGTSVASASPLTDANDSTSNPSNTYPSSDIHIEFPSTITSTIASTTPSSTPPELQVTSKLESSAILVTTTKSVNATASSNPSRVDHGLIGGIVSAIVVLVAILLSAFCIWRRRRIHHNEKMVSNYPFAGHGRNHSTPSSIGFNPLAMVRQKSRRSIGTILSSFRRTRRRGVPKDRDDMTSISGFTTYTGTTGVFSSDLACSSVSQDKMCRAEGHTANSGGPTSLVDEKSTFDPPPAPFTLTPVRSQYFN